MTDIELLDKFCETCLEYIQPATFRIIEKRGLAHIVNRLPQDINEAKAIVRGRLSKSGRYIGDPQIEQIADVIARLDQLRNELKILNLADVHKTLPVLQEMTDHSRFLKEYFKEDKIY